MAHGYPDFEGLKSGVYLTPEWAAFEQSDKNLYAFGANKGWTETAVISYTVPDGVTLYICGAAFMAMPSNQADADNHIYCYARLYNGTTAVCIGECGGKGGGIIPLGKPVSLQTGQALSATVVNRSGIDCSLSISVWGYEV